MKYTVTGKSVLLTSGLLTLTAAQAADRAHLVKPSDKQGQYIIVAPVTFKSGEVFDYDGELPKGIGAESGENPTAKPGNKTPQKPRSRNRKTATTKQKTPDKKPATEPAANTTAGTGEGNQS